MLKRIAYIRSSDIYNDSRATKEILALEEAGYQITVLAWNRSGKAEKECASVFCSKNIVFEFYNVPIPCGIGVKNIGKLFGFFKWVKKTLKKNVDSIDIIHACDLDGAVGAYSFCIKNEKPLVYDIFDYYIDSHYVPRVLSGIVEKQEIKIINLAH